MKVLPTANADQLALFTDGKLDGAWSIFDASGKLVSEVHFAGGQRDGHRTLGKKPGDERLTVYLAFARPCLKRAQLLLGIGVHLRFDPVVDL